MNAFDDVPNWPDDMLTDAERGGRDAWIGVAEADVRASPRPYELVPADAEVRAWSGEQASAVEWAGREVYKAAREAATRLRDGAREALDYPAEQRAEVWLRECKRIAAGPRRGPKPPGRWLEVAAMTAEALGAWLPDDALSDEPRRALVWLGRVSRDRAERLSTALAAALDKAVAAEVERRSAAGAWEAEVERRGQAAANERAADAARAAAQAAADSVLFALNAPEQYQVSPPYELDRDGVWMVRPVEGGDPIRTRIATAPLLVTRVFTDPAGDQLVELAWKDRGQAVTRTVPRAVAKSGRQLVKVLGNAGIPIVEADARQVERYLAGVEADNRQVIPRDRLARQLGWQADGEFVTGQDIPVHVEPAFEEQRAPLAAHRPCGTLPEWQAVVKLIEPYPIPRIMLSAGFAAPLLEILRIDSFTIDLSGRSTGGKTVSAMVAFSIWGCPTEQGGGIASWRTTLMAAEKRLNLCNGVPVVFDETRAVKVEGLVDQVLYQVPMNRGTSRGGGYPSDLPWRTVLISTGEQPALSFTTNEGASARILSLRGAPFGRQGETSERVASEVGAGAAGQFGTAGPAFVARLSKELKTPGGADRLRRRHRELTASHQEGSDINKRRAPRVAAVRLAGELAYEWSICPLAPLETKQWTDLLAVEQQRDDRGEMALDIAREFVGRQANRMWTPTTRPETMPSLGWIGAYLEDAGRKSVALLPKALGEELDRAGYRIDAVREAWRERGLIALDRSGELIRRRFDGGRLRVYEFDRAVFDAVEPAPEPQPCAACGWPLDSAGHAENCAAPAQQELHATPEKVQGY